MNPKRFTPSKVSKDAGISVGEVLSIINSKKAQQGHGREHSGGEGREDLRDFFVARRRANDPGWDNGDPDVAAARAAVCAGTHTMATHRDGPWLFLCSIPLDRPVARQPHYFLAGAA